MVVRILKGVVFGTVMCYVGFVIGRASKECPAMVQGKYYQVLPPVAEPAINTISCDTQSLHDALELLRVCRARARSEKVK